MSTPDELLAQAIAAARAGHNDLARQQFQAVLRANPRNELAWLWLSGLLDNPSQKRDCLQRVLALNPGNEVARRGLERLAQSEAASFLSTFEPRTPAPAPTPPAMPPPAVAAVPIPGDAPAAAEPIMPVPIELPAAPPSTPITPQAAAPIELPPVSKVTEAPCVFCAAPTGIEAHCHTCGMEQAFDCPNCGRVLDLREALICECGQSFQQFLISGGIDRERLGETYLARDYPGAAVKQWKAAIPTSAKAAVLHRKIAQVYLDLGLIEQARMHNELSKQK